MREIAELIQKCNRFIFTTHVNPDGDALGCQLALAYYLRSCGKSFRIINCSNTPDNYLFLDREQLIEVYDSNIHDPALMDAEIIFLIDTNLLNRLQNMETIVRRSSAKKVIIDHHPEPDDTGYPAIVDTNAPATGEIIYRLLCYLDPRAITQPVAEALYVAIMTDTGSFRFPKTSSETHQIISSLLEKGIDPSIIYREVYEKMSVNRLKLLGQVLAQLSTTFDGKVAYTFITKEMFRSTGTSLEDADNFIQYTLLIKDVVVGILFTELEDGVKISFRSKGDIPINELAKEFGGNGHRNAAGAWTKGISLDDIIKQTLEKTQQYL